MTAPRWEPISVPDMSVRHVEYGLDGVMSPCTTLMPDLDRDFLSVLFSLEELLVTYVIWEQDGEIAPGELPAPLADRVADDALHRIWDVLPYSRGGIAEIGRTGHLLADDGYRYPPLHLVSVDQADIATLSAVARLLGDPYAPEVVGRGLRQGHISMSPEELVIRVARLATQLAGLVELAGTPDAEVLRARLVTAGSAEDIVLSPAEEAAYRRTMTLLRARFVADQ
ncbi:hypothetical protein AB0395_28955 [Streptosporangium sp. NPDC051023]|uniref:hypothetical protein n=1 Tax=Streptosporangium sp. NPDC051023 TaxID=3155410 RepID=UPI00344C9157